jgi:hypothetical protein
LRLGRAAAEKSKYSEKIQIFRKNPKIPVYSFNILNNPFRKILVIFPKNPQNSQKPQKSSKFPKILKNPQNLTIRKFHYYSQKSSKNLKIPKKPQKYTKF